MVGIYTASNGNWSNPAQEDLVIDIVGDPLIGSRKVVPGDSTDITITGAGDSLPPPPGTIVFVLGIGAIPDGMYVVNDDE